MSEFAISFDESASFARLSGDFNPLHLDRVRARRTQYGRTVVHGIHALLKALDGVGAVMSLDRFEPVAIACTFNGPIPTDAVVRVDASLNASGDRLRLVGEAEGRSAFSLTVDLQHARAGRLDTLAGSDFDPAPPRTQAMPAPGQEGAAPIQLASARYSRLFPWLARGCNADWVGDLIATTRIVGMECPGMHSIYSGLKLRRSAGPASEGARWMRYRVEKNDPRFRLVRLGVAGAAFEGTIEAFLRPAPVDQQSLADISSTVEEAAFLGQRALVIGGSRGLGELTAKILMAGGADVTITYALGREDAERVADEAGMLGRRCSMMHMDVTAPMNNGMAKSLATGFSHIYYFASPQIFKNRAASWDHGLFENFCRVYLRAFAIVAECVLSGEKHRHDPVRMFFPSTVFLDHPEDGFAEYCAAKAAGESLCDYFASKHRAIFARPRLPRMRTDQTSGLSTCDAEEPFAVMHPVLLAFHNALPGPGA